MVTAFAQGAESKNHEVTVIQVGKKKINGCVGCEYCHIKGNHVCVQKDEMQEVYDAIKETDMLVFASPIYFYTFTSQFQAALMRLYAIANLLKIKQSALLLSSASPDVYDAAITQYKCVTGYMKAEDRGIIMIYGSKNQSEEMKKELYDFGASI